MALSRRAVCQGALPLLLAGPALAAPRRVREVLAFYYAWYGDPGGHADWRGEDKVQRRIENAAHYPVGGAYDSADPAVIDRQMRQMRAAGITGLIYSWWGRGSFEDWHFRAVLDSARQFGLRASVYYETCPKINHAPDPAGVAADLEYLIETAVATPNWLRAGEQRVFFLYGYPLQQLGHVAWRDILDAARRRHPGSVMFSADAEHAAGLEFMDSIHRYALVANVGRRTPERVAAWAADFYPFYMREQAQFRIKTLTVYPGYDDTHLRRARAVDSGRFDGALYATLWEAAAAQSPDWILITSWNEWHEGSEVEPSVEFGTTYLTLTARYAGAFTKS